MNTEDELYKAGGTAFPVTEDTCAGAWHGLTKRDYFAAAALTGLIAGIQHWSLVTDNGKNAPMATYAYKIADAMLKAREES